MTNKIFCEMVYVTMKLYKIPIQTMTAVTNFQSRLSKENLSYRYYPSWSTHTLILFHGLVSSSIYLSALAHRLAERKIAQVILPDFRGHGDDQRNLKWNKSHDVLQDFEEMMIHFKTRTAVERISFMGHSFGARWMKKILSDAPASLKVDHTFMLAPFISDNQIKGDWLVSQDNSYKVNWPDGIRTGKEVFEYPKDFLDIFSTGSITAAHLIEASDDEILKPVEGYDFKTQTMLAGATHMGLVIDKKFIDQICDQAEKTIL